MSRRAARLICLLIASTAALAACGGGDGGDYPSEDITFIIPYGTGGSTDPVGRQYASLLEEELGATVVVENREGGSATIGTSAVAEADPDGYTLGLSSNSALAFAPLSTEGLPYSSPSDYQSLIKLVDLPTVLAVKADSPWQTFEEFMADAEARPGELRVSVSGALTTPDLAIRELNQVAGVEITTVPFTGGGGESLAALLSGQIEATSSYGPQLKGQIEAGKVRALAVFSADEYAFMPDTPTATEAGYEVVAPASYYAFAPKGLPEDVLKTLVDTSQAIVGSEEFKSFADANGYSLEPLTPTDMAAELEKKGLVYMDLYQEMDNG